MKIEVSEDEAGGFLYRRKLNKYKWKFLWMSVCMLMVLIAFIELTNDHLDDWIQVVIAVVLMIPLFVYINWKGSQLEKEAKLELKKLKESE